MSTSERMRLLMRLEESKRERERQTVHPTSCKCKGHGNLPQSQFSIGFVRCSVE